MLPTLVLSLDARLRLHNPLGWDEDVEPLRALRLQSRALTPRAIYLQGMQAICAWGREDPVEGRIATLDQLLRYRSFAEQALPGIRINESAVFLGRGIYPLDLHPRALELLAVEKLPHNLDELVVWQPPEQRFFNIIGRWGLWIIAPDAA